MDTTFSGLYSYTGLITSISKLSAVEDYCITLKVDFCCFVESLLEPNETDLYMVPNYSIASSYYRPNR